MLCAKFGLNWHSGSEDEYFLKFATLQLSPLANGSGSSLEELEPHHPKMLCVKFGLNWPLGTG